MVSCACNGGLSARDFAEFEPGIGFELGPAVGNDSRREPVILPYPKIEGPGGSFDVHFIHGDVPYHLG